MTEQTVPAKYDDNYYRPPFTGRINQIIEIQTTPEEVLTTGDLTK